MRLDYHVQKGESGGWIVLQHVDRPLADFRRRIVAEAFGRALAHRAKVSLIVHLCDDRRVRYSAGDLTYATLI